MKTAYVQKRDNLIKEVENLAEIVYRNDREMLLFVIDLTIALQTAEESEEFVNDLSAFIKWAEIKNKSKGYVLTTVIHDLSGFMRREGGFLPRSHGYSINMKNFKV